MSDGITDAYRERRGAEYLQDARDRLAAHLISDRTGPGAVREALEHVIAERRYVGASMARAAEVLLGSDALRAAPLGVLTDFAGSDPGLREALMAVRGEEIPDVVQLEWTADQLRERLGRRFYPHQLESAEWRAETARLAGELARKLAGG
jgi:hypothetical protein